LERKKNGSWFRHLAWRAWHSAPAITVAGSDPIDGMAEITDDDRGQESYQRKTTLRIH